MYRNFSDFSTDPVGFGSVNSTGEGDQQDEEIQTEAIACSSQAVQSGQNVDVQVQADEVVKTFQNISFDEESLSSFLTDVTPHILKELDKLERNKAFTSHLELEENSSEAKKLFTLKYTDNPITGNTGESLEVLSMDWSCTGSTIALGCGQKTHLNWCTHRSHVRFYNIDKYSFDGSEPLLVVETPACVTSIAMHPYEPSIVAVGTYSGNILIWDLRKDNVNLENKINHTDIVTQLAWVNINSELFLVSSSLDGLMFKFKVTSRLGSITINDRYLLGDCIPEIRQYPGVTCFSFSPSQQGTFVAGLEGGTLLQCYLHSSTTKIRERDGAIFKDPTVKTISKEHGIITSIAFSPYEKTMFSVAVADKKFLIYTLNELQPNHILWADFDVYRLAWSPSQANIIFAWATYKGVAVYNSNTGRKVGILNAEMSEDAGLIEYASCNTKCPRLLAVSSTKGDTSIWEIPALFKAN